MTLTKSSTILISCIALVLPVANAETITLDINQALERAYNTDPRISEKKKLVDAARGLLEEAKGAESWVFDVNSFVGLSPDVKGGIFEDSQGNLNISKDALDFTGVSPWYNLQFQIVYPFNTLGKSESYAEAAENNIRVKTGDVEIQKASTYVDVMTAYYGYLGSRDAVLMLEKSKETVQSAIDLVQSWLDKGQAKAKQSDLFALQTGMGVLNRYLEEARALNKIARDGLKLLTGVAENTDVELADKRLQPVELPEENLAQLQEKAMEQRPEMMQVRAGMKARRALLAAKKAEKYPNFYTGIAGSISYSPNRPRLDNINIYDPFNHAGATPIVGVKWDWWVGRQQGQVTQAEGEYNAMIEKKSFAQKGIPFQVAEQYHQVHAYRKMVDDMYDAARSGRRWMVATYADFEAGVEEPYMVMTAFQAYVLAYTDYLKIVNEYNLHVARLKVATGDIK
ncbi:MAG: TolC family protein [Gammaproteobacteria bacterium]|jgi:outer membrane protein TolC